MALDNMLAVGAASHGNIFLLLTGLGDNVQDIVYSKNGHDIVNSKLCGFVFYDAVT
jgi:hypothetical protein